MEAPHCRERCQPGQGKARQGNAGMEDSGPGCPVFRLVRQPGLEWRGALLFTGRPDGQTHVGDVLCGALLNCWEGMCLRCAVGFEGRQTTRQPDSQTARQPLSVRVKSDESTRW